LRVPLPGPPWAAVIAPFAMLYIALALLMPVPMYMPDEAFYEHLAHSLAVGDGMTWRGDGQSLRAALYVYALAPVWVVASGLQAYQLAKVETALLFCTVAAPIWMLARDLMSRRAALVAVGLSLTGTWMVSSGSLMTESIALPAATASMALTVNALRRSSPRLLWLALTFALLATWARIQVIVLVPCVFTALALDIARHGRQWRPRARVFRWPLAMTAGILLTAGAVLAVASTTVLGGYRGILNYDFEALDVVEHSGLELLQLVALSGVLPVLLLAAMSTRRMAWRDSVVGPFLSVLVPAVLILALENGFYTSGTSGLAWSIQRYMVYAAPMLLLFCIVAFTRPGLVTVKLLVLTFVLAFGLLLTPEVQERTEERAVFATVERIRDIVPPATAGTAMTVVGGLLVGIAMFALWSGTRRPGADRPPVAVGLALLVLLGAQSATAWTWQHYVASMTRSSLPDDLGWVDHHTTGRVSVLALTSSSVPFLMSEFFNNNIDRLYLLYRRPPGVLPPSGGSCSAKIESDGLMTFPGDCPPPSDEYFVNDPTGHLTFHNEVSRSYEPKAGAVVQLNGRPRVESKLITPCGPSSTPVEVVTLKALPRTLPIPCSTQMDLTLWLDDPGTVVIGVRGAPYGDHIAEVGGTTHRIKAVVLNTFRVRVPAGKRRVNVIFDWGQQSSLDARLVSVDLEQEGRRKSLF
jgi:hypothetical protein